MKELNKKENNWKVTAMAFYAKTTAWILFPVLFSLLIKNLFSLNSDFAFPILMGLSFGATCYGIFKEIKKYQKGLEKNGK